MAKSKNATALFEVIHTAKKPPKSSTSVSVPTPKWWAKSKPPAAARPGVETTEAAGRQGSWLAAAAKRGVLPTPVSSTDSADPDVHESSHERIDSADTSVEADPGITAIPAVPEPVEHAAPKPRFAERFAERFARKVASAALPVEPPVARVETPETTPAVEVPEQDMDVEETAPVSAVRKTRRSVTDRDGAVAVDRGAREVQFRLSYGGLISLAFILILIITLAALIGLHYSGSVASDTRDESRRTTESAGSANLLATETLPAEGFARGTSTGQSLSVPDRSAQAPVTAAVGADNSGSTPAVTTVRPDVLAVTRHPAKPTGTSGLPVPRSADPAEQVPPVNPVREVGTTYLVIQSYDEKQLAQKACDFLNRSGVKCSLVQGLKDWAPRDWYCVVGLEPFTANDPNLNGYERKVTALGLKFSNKQLNQFEPKPYVWHADSDSQSGDSGN
jgi:hypothetical protein